MKLQPKVKGEKLETKACQTCIGKFCKNDLGVGFPQCGYHTHCEHCEQTTTQNIIFAGKRSGIVIFCCTTCGKTRKENPSFKVIKIEENYPTEAEKCEHKELWIYMSNQPYSVKLEPKTEYGYPIAVKVTCQYCRKEFWLVGYLKERGF